MGPDNVLGSVLVLGLGKSGKSAARYCMNLLGGRVTSLFIAAGARNADSEAFVESLVEQAADERVGWAFGDDALSALEAAGRHFDLCIASPGIPFWNDLYEGGLRLADEVISEVEFAFRESDPASTWIAITGTNGKTTTTSCCASVLRACGFHADAVGNIGDVCLDAVAAGKTDVYVAEVSSYQLFSAPTFAPDIAVMLNITPDHIHWHKTFEAYRDAKFKVLDNMTKRGCESDASAAGRLVARPVAILDATNDVVRAKVRSLKSLTLAERGFDYIPLGTADGISGDMRLRCGADNAAFIDAGGMMHVAYAGAEHALLSADELLIKGSHNASNALAAAAVAVALGADDRAIARALAQFAPLEHRIEPCGDVAGVVCYNDSKATNVDATLKALQAFPGKRLVVMLGGDDKGTDLSELVEATLAHAQAVVCFGAAAGRFEDAFEGMLSRDKGGVSQGFSLAVASHLEDALDKALSLAGPGDVVLLSPACASFDEFKSFEERGTVFKRLVAERAMAAQGQGE